ncbi:MAG: TonB-dependent receptor, partial [Pseudomonadales bacterium]
MFKKILCLAFVLGVSPVLVANQLETVTVTAKRYAAKQLNLDSNIAIVNDAALQTTGHTHVTEVLARVPGTWISRGNGQEHLTAIRSPVLTGAGACGAFLIAADGVPLRAPGFCNVNQMFEVNSEQAQRIEVLRGPGSVLYGSNAEHGIINFITADPAEQQQTRLSLAAGPHDYQRIKFSHSLPINRHHGLLVYANGGSDGGYKDDSGFDQQKINIVHRYERGQRN